MLRCCGAADTSGTDDDGADMLWLISSSTRGTHARWACAEQGVCREVCDASCVVCCVLCVVCCERCVALYVKPWSATRREG